MPDGTDRRARCGDSLADTDAPREADSPDLQRTWRGLTLTDALNADLRYRCTVDGPRLHPTEARTACRVTDWLPQHLLR